MRRSMHGKWTYRDWRPGGERSRLDGVTFDSTIHCGAGQNFHQVGRSHYRFRARAGLEPYAWRFHFRIESPRDGREVVVEVADFNHFGQELWQEQATVLSRDGENWPDLGTANIRIVPWTPTGERDDASLNDGSHPPYGVQYRLRLDAPTLWLASPTPYTLRCSKDHQQGLAARCEFVTVEEIGRPHYFRMHGFPIWMTRIAGPGSGRDRIRLVIIAGEHAAEVAGMYACEGLMEEIVRSPGLLDDFAFWIVPVVNVDGVALGRTYHTVAADEPLGRGVNLARDWRERTQPEAQAVWRVIEAVRPHCVLSLHNGRHRREFEVLAPPRPRLERVLRCLREQMPISIEHKRPAPEGSVEVEAVRAGLADMSLCFETLLLQKLPHCDTFKESYRRTGAFLLRGLAEGLGGAGIADPSASLRTGRGLGIAD